MRYWKFTPGGGLTPFYHIGPVPEWKIDQDAIVARQLGVTPDEDSQLTLIPFEVALENGQKTYVFAREYPGKEIVEAIRDAERTRYIEQRTQQPGDLQ